MGAPHSDRQAAAQPTPPVPPEPRHADPADRAGAPDESGSEPAGFRLRRPSLGERSPGQPRAEAPMTPPPGGAPQPPSTQPPTTGQQPLSGRPSPRTGQQPAAPAETPSAEDTSERLRAVNPDPSRQRSAASQTPSAPAGPLAGLAPSAGSATHGPDTAVPGGYPSAPAPAPGSSTYHAPAPTEGVTQFAEPGRGHLGVGGTQHAQATPAHLDPRIAGLTNTAPRRRRGVSQFFHRSSDDVIAGNPSSGALHNRIELPRRISVVGLKGGVGKTTMSILLSMTAARERREPVLILDSDTTYGSLALRTGIVPVASAHDVARMGDPGSRQIFATSISRTDEDVWVLPTGRSPEQSANFTDRTYVETMRAVYRHFPIIVTDCGAGMAGPLMQRVISASHALVIATSPSMDGILASHNALQWLASLGYTDLLQRTVIAMSNVTSPPQIDLDATRERFSSLCRGLITVPADPHLAPGSHVSYDALADRTRQAAKDLTSVTLEAALSAG